MAESKEFGRSITGNASDEVALLKHTKDGIALYPQPSDDPADPLNWSLTSKIFTLFIVALAGGIGAAQVLALNSGYFIQAELYGKTAVQLSYGVRCPHDVFWSVADTVSRLQQALLDWQLGHCSGLRLLNGWADHHVSSGERS